jgi:predicted  nucleic acid-binding Zn-ribbon protein
VHAREAFSHATAAALIVWGVAWLPGPSFPVPVAQIGVAPPQVPVDAWAYKLSVEVGLLGMVAVNLALNAYGRVKDVNEKSLGGQLSKCKECLDSMKEERDAELARLKEESERSRKEAAERYERMAAAHAEENARKEKALADQARDYEHRLNNKKDELRYTRQEVAALNATSQDLIAQIRLLNEQVVQQSRTISELAAKSSDAVHDTIRVAAESVHNTRKALAKVEPRDPPGGDPAAGPDPDPAAPPNAFGGAAGPPRNPEEAPGAEPH